MIMVNYVALASVFIGCGLDSWYGHFYHSVIIYHAKWCHGVWKSAEEKASRAVQAIQVQGAREASSWQRERRWSSAIFVFGFCIPSWLAVVNSLRRQGMVKTFFNLKLKRKDRRLKHSQLKHSQQTMQNKELTETGRFIAQQTKWEPN